ncbi:MAG: hypothetical protein KAR19_18810 [Bacteroidales bacterium]|nr:hypothetical protein [Bacteroidales bacterium]
MPLFWPLHPRARKQLELFGLWDKVVSTPNLVLLRPITLYEHGGASVLVGNNVERIREEYQNALVKERKQVRPDLWDGHTAERCLEAIVRASDI